MIWIFFKCDKYATKKTKKTGRGKNLFKALYNLFIYNKHTYVFIIISSSSINNNYNINKYNYII